MTVNDLPTPAVVALVLLSAVQIAVEVVALVVLARTPSDRIQSGRKWPWVLAILLVNLIGAIVFLAVGRRPVVVEAPVPEKDPSTISTVVDELYGNPDR